MIATIIIAAIAITTTTTATVIPAIAPPLRLLVSSLKSFTNISAGSFYSRSKTTI